MTSTSRSLTPIAIGLVLVVVPVLGGCLGSTETPSGPSVPFASFDDAMEADGPTFKPAGTAETYTNTMDGNEVTDVDYQNSHDVPVESTDAMSVNVTATLTSGSPADELQFVLQDSDGSQVASATLTPDSNTAELSTADIPNTGTWTVQVSGRAVQASYSLDVEIPYASTDPLTVKVLEPESLTGLVPGETPFVFLLYDEDEQAPVTDAAVSHESWAVSHGHGGGEEQDASHLDYGIYRGTIHPNMEASWEIQLEVEDVRDEPVQFKIPMDVEE